MQVNVQQRHLDSLIHLMWTSLQKVLLSLAIWASLATVSFGQERQFFNGGFEENDPGGPGAPTFQIYVNANVPEWQDETGFIELWDSGFQNTPAFEGNVFAEMNANSPGSIYQEFCVQNGETISWRFAHRARPGGSAPNPQTVTLEFADMSGNSTQIMATQSSFTGGGWTQNTGTTTYTGPTGIRRIQFSTTDPGSLGNFLDDLEINIAAFAEFAANTGADLESSTASLPMLTVSGIIDVETTIPVSVIGGTATAQDFTLTANEITIPIGSYRDDLFPLPLVIDNNSVPETDETIIFQLGAPSTSEITLGSLTCDGAPAQAIHTYTIINDDPDIESVKSVAPFQTSGPDSYALPGNDMIYSLTTTNLGTVDLDNNSIFMTDALPAEIAFYNGDIDDLGPETEPIIMETTNTSLTLNYSTDIGFSNNVAQPSNFSECSFIPATGYDELGNIKHICFAPKGSFEAGTPNPVFTLKFKVRIR